MQYQLPPRNWVQDGENCRLATDEEYAEYLSIILSIEGMVLLDEKGNPFNPDSLAS